MKSQLSIIRSIMLRGRYWTIPGLRLEVKKRTGVWMMETTVSARIRDLRKSAHGGYQVDRQRDAKSKLYKYRLIHI